MIESPVLQEVLAETRVQNEQESILRVLRARFGTAPEDVSAAVRTIPTIERLHELLNHAAVCPDLEAFRTQLAAKT